MPELAIAERLGAHRRLVESLGDARVRTEHEERFRRLLDELAEHEVTVHPNTARLISHDPRRLAALWSRDFLNRGTAAEHIQRIAAAGTLHDGQPSAPLAAMLVHLVGQGGAAGQVYGMSYARTMFQIFATHHAGEFTRILADLSTEGHVTLANGDRVNWNPELFPAQQNREADALWGGLSHLLTHRVLPPGATLASQAPAASQGQMANVASRLFGVPFINVPGPNALAHLNAVTDTFGPVLAAYGQHAGSVATVTPERQLLSLEVGQREPVLYSQSPLGYVVVPTELAMAKGMPAIQYGTEGDTDYAYPPPALTEEEHAAAETPMGPPLRASAADKAATEEMVSTLRGHDVRVPARLAQRIASDPARLEALRATDFQGGATAFDHIVRVAEARTLIDGRPAAELALDLFGLVGTSRYSHGSARCYARTNHTIFTLYHPGEFARVVGELGTRGEVRLASGDTIRWDPATYPKPGVVPTADFLWGNVNHLIRHRIIPWEGRINAESNVAMQGQMANIHSRLFGRSFVNVNGILALPHLNDVIREVGPLPAEYGAHGGSVSTVNEDGTAMSLEPGATQGQPVQGLGYVVFPAKEAQAHGLAALEYPASDNSYAELPAPPVVATPRRRVQRLPG